MDACDFVEPPLVTASTVFKRRGRWYAQLCCPGCAAALRVRLSLGPMVARCDACATNVEADIGLVVCSGHA
jgi:hypothetical protein